MRASRFHLVLASALLAVSASAQCDACAMRLRERYTEEQIADLRERGHYKYAGLLLFYGASFEVEQDGGFRAPTEDEILAIDLHAYDQARSATKDAIVQDAGIGRRIRLLSRNRFEELVLERLSPADRSAYLEYKAGALEAVNGKSP